MIMSREKKVLINLLSIARYEHTPDFPIQFMTKGTISLEKNNHAILEYTESQQDEETGEINTSFVTLLLEKDRVIMTRKGDYANTMVFVPEQRFEGTYQTPYGEMNMGVYARDVHCRIGAESGSVHLKYQIDVQGAYTSSNELHLEYTAEQKGKAQ